jgi:hypothetical protein
MRRGALAAAAVVGLVAAGVAVADSIGTRAIKPVGATFTATTVNSSSTRTCQGSEGPISMTTLDLSGTSASADAALNGPVRIRLTSTVDTVRQIGTVDGSLRVVISGAPDTTTRLEGVYSAGKLHGLLRGTAARLYERVLGNVSASLGGNGLTNGKIGGTDAGGGALLRQPGTCKKPAAEWVVATGIISALTDTSITVATTTCSMDAQQRRHIGDRFKVGDRAKMTCRIRDGKLMLEKLSRA